MYRGTYEPDNICTLPFYQANIIASTEESSTRDWWKQMEKLMEVS